MQMQILRLNLNRFKSRRAGLAAASAAGLAGLAVALSLLLSSGNLPDMEAYPAGEERKAAFFGYLAPIVAANNADILRDREILQAMADELDADGSLSFWQQYRLRSLAEKYALEDDDADPAQRVRRLLRRADAVPLPLVLVQAAKESGWGTSRFAREANNLFGQWCFETGCGVVPERRAEGAVHEVRQFDSVDDAVAAYLRNINTGSAYRALREMRSAQRRAGEKPGAMTLADGLLFYSERREDYVNEVKRMIVQYHRFRETREA